MHGSVWEFCLDMFAAPYPDAAQTNPLVSEGTRRVVRGGNFLFDAGNARSACRGSFTLDATDMGLGFRIVRNPQRP